MHYFSHSYLQVPLNPISSHHTSRHSLVHKPSRTTLDQTPVSGPPRQTSLSPDPDDFLSRWIKDQKEGQMTFIWDFYFNHPINFLLPPPSYKLKKDETSFELGNKKIYLKHFSLFNISRDNDNKDLLVFSSFEGSNLTSKIKVSSCDILKTNPFYLKFMVRVDDKKRHVLIHINTWVLL